MTGAGSVYCLISFDHESIFLSLPIACAACKQRELLRTQITDLCLFRTTRVFGKNLNVISLARVSLLVKKDGSMQLPGNTSLTRASVS